MDIKIKKGNLKVSKILAYFLDKEVLESWDLDINEFKRRVNTIDIEFKGKNILLIDDSIVRGYTS